MSGDERTRGLRRREFLSGAMATTATGLLPIKTHGADEQVGHDVKAYKTLGRTGLRISDISFGSSRLRTGEEDLVKYAFDRGVNYFDTAESYTGGDSETVIGNALRGKRDKVYVVSKVSAGASERKESMMSALEGSLRRLQTDYVDIYFNHAVNDIARLDNPEWREFTEAAKKQGKIRFVGMSGHAGNLIGCLDHAIDTDSVDAVLVAYNFGQDPKFYERLTRSFDFVAVQPDLPRVLAKAKAKNVGVVTMKTLMGARLNDMRPYETGGATFAQAAFRWTLSNPHVDGVVISMTSHADDRRIPRRIGRQRPRARRLRTVAAIRDAERHELLSARVQRLRGRVSVWRADRRRVAHAHVRHRLPRRRVRAPRVCGTRRLRRGVSVVHRPTVPGRMSARSPDRGVVRSYSHDSRVSPPT